MDESPVLIAGEADEAGLIEHLRLHHEENGVFGMMNDAFPPDEEEILSFLHGSFDRKGGIVGIIRDGDRLAASVGLRMSKLWWAKKWILEELWTFVHPECRASSHAHDLHKFGKDCATKLNMPLLAGVVAGADTERKIRLYQRAYGYPSGVYFMFHAGQEPAVKPNGKILFWDHPFPRPGVSVVSTQGLSQDDLDRLSRWKNPKKSPREAAAHG